MTDIAQARIFQRFFQTETLSALLLLIFSVLALALANSSFASIYAEVWTMPLGIGSGDHALTLTLHEWINQGLMSVFFLLVGLEVKRELLAGELASAKTAALPLAAAIGGMALPALIYFAVNPSGQGLRGWGTPMATDIAFALGALALIAPGTPKPVKIFLAALAIIDDMGAVLVIAIFYSKSIIGSELSWSALLLALLIVFNIARVTRLTPYLLVGIALWFFVQRSGLHPSVVGVAVAMTIPTRTRIDAAQFSAEARQLLDQFDRAETGDLAVLTSEGQQGALFALERASARVTAPILVLENALHRFSAFVVMPLFAFANAGVNLAGPVSNLQIAGGVFAGLLIGKPLGITGGAWLATKFRIARLPSGINWATLHGVSWLGGIGFTMSLFIATLAFDEPALLIAAKLATMASSLLAGLIGAVLLNFMQRRA